MSFSRTAGMPGEVGQFKIATDMPRMEEALELLKKLHSLCKPIQKKYGWYLPTLTEFFPSNPNLLGMNQNGGQTIFIRLRPAHDKSTFLPLEDSLVGTLLHEFTHNVHGPHHKQFYEFLDRLQDEYDALRAGGYTGEGFLSEGKRAGTTRDLPTYLAREKALQEAQKRQKIFDIMGPVGGSRLGSSRAPAGKTPKQMAADAAERRARDDKACGHGLNVSDASVEEEMKQATQHSTTLEGASKPDNRAESTHRQSDSDSDIEIIENPMLTAPSAGSSSRASRRKPDSTGSTAPSAKRARRDSISSSGNTRPARLQNSSWICMICTYDNDKALGLACEMCGSERQSAFDPEQLLEPNPKPRIMKNSRVNLPVDSKRMWTCHLCGAETEHEWWTCRLCGHMKLSSATS